MGTISNTANIVLEELNKIDVNPITAEVEFSIKITGQGKAVIASGGMEANYKIKLAWSKK